MYYRKKISKSEKFTLEIKRARAEAREEIEKIILQEFLAREGKKYDLATAKNIEQQIQIRVAELSHTLQGLTGIFWNHKGYDEAKKNHDEATNNLIAARNFARIIERKSFYADENFKKYSQLNRHRVELAMDNAEKTLVLRREQIDRAKSEIARAKDIAYRAQSKKVRGNQGVLKDFLIAGADPKNSGQIACYYCGSATLIQYVHVDHKIPVSRGGRNDAKNLVLCCSNCNLRKGVLTAEEFVNLLDRSKSE